VVAALEPLDVRLHDRLARRRGLAPFTRCAESLSDGGRGLGRVINANHQAVVALVGQADHYCPGGIMHIPEHPDALVVEGPSRDDAGSVGAWATPALPVTHRLRIGLGAGHVRQWDLKAALETPESVHALDLDAQSVAEDLDLRHVDSRPSVVPCST
jgi:hypothetical protein